MTIVEPVSYSIININAKDEDYAIWTNGVEVKQSNFYIYKNRIYKAIKNFTSVMEPDADLANFADYGASNKNKFQDEFISTKTVNDNDLIINLNLEQTAYRFALLNLQASKVFLWQDGVLIHSQDTLYKKAKSWWEYFFKPFTSKTQAVFLTKPLKGNVELVLSKINNFAGLGHLVVGIDNHVGKTLIKPEISLLDYSKKKTDEWGNSFILKGATAKNIKLEIAILTNNLDSIINLIEKFSGQKILFLGDEREFGFSSVNLFGFITNADVQVQSKISILNLTIQGLV